MQRLPRTLYVLGATAAVVLALAPAASADKLVHPLRPAAQDPYQIATPDGRPFFVLYHHGTLFARGDWTEDALSDPDGPLEPPIRSALSAPPVRPRSPTVALAKVKATSRGTCVWRAAGRS
jgi:hypothetical protein